ncbi:hypothetical protein CSC2_00530 [Clostridium zeae]|uniref:ABC transporter domain-containing protein n=1 Tax=Clostridium zeae TaxID=2759022 RepID=A0ABQ1E459_9CLOT|nr:ABC transporter ATP-binding protein [Clostridium zeae]GFZ29527.1 hypothetical protein CSC2_00530 [Clostridium zeae]
MIHCKTICKKYGQEKVLDSFSYTFKENGFVLLYGESGCGKTTLLNILAGMTIFDEGEIIFKKNKYENKVDYNKISNDIGYITQDTHFIDYLTVFDNLRLCSTDDEYIMEFLKKFGLVDIKDNYPITLSGGEKQRIAIIQALLGEKDILLLDEPTASLDRENKLLIFNILNELKNSKLIICSSHDYEAKVYADEIIDFNNLQSVKPNENISATCFETKGIKNKRKLYPFFRKQYKYHGREKKSKIQLTIVFFLAVIALCICDTPQSKTDSNIQYTYHLNQLQLSTVGVNKSLLTELSSNNKVLEVDLMYNRSVPDGIDDEKDITSNVNYNITAETLPFREDAFPLAHDIEYGSYYTKAEQIILSYDMALSIGNPKDLIGQTLKVDLFDKSYDMEIVGVFKRFSKIEKQYLWASGIYLGNNNDTFFINGEFTKRYVENKDFLMHGQRIYTAYFSDFKDMKLFYENNNYNYKQDEIKLIYADIGNDISFLFQSMFAILFPIVLVIIPVAVLLYYQTWKIKMVYNKHIFSVYQYLGYSAKEIKRCWIVTSLEEVIKMLLSAMLVAFPLMWITNLINSKIIIIPFQIFTYNSYLILLLNVLIIVLNIIVSTITLNKVKMSGWYQILLEQRDLI